MPKATFLQQSFNAGEVSPLYYGRVGEERYKSSMVSCVNFVPTLQGPLITKPGTKFMNAVKSSTNPPVLIPYIYSENLAYMLEFGQQYIRFYINNGQVTDPSNYYQVVSALGNFTRNSQYPVQGESSIAYTLVTGPAILELKTPYALSDVSTIKHIQNNNQLILTHPEYYTMVLSQVSTYEWSLQYFNFQDGPYMAQNSYLTLADGALGSGAPIYLIPSALNSASVTATLTTGPSATISGAANNGAGLIRITATAHPYQTGDKVFISGVVGTTEANNVSTFVGSGATYWLVIKITANTFDLVGSAFVNAYSSAGTAYPALFLNPQNLTAFLSGRRLVAWVDPGVTAGRVWGGMALGSGYANQINVVYAPFSNAVNTFQMSTTANITSWYFGKFIPPGINYLSATVPASMPSCSCFHEDRLAFSGSPNYPQDLDASSPGVYTQFSPTLFSNIASVTAANALNFTLLSRHADNIQWLGSTAQGLLAGGYESEWCVSASTQGEALAPANVNANQTSFFGSANVDAVQASNAVLYVQRAGRKLRELNYFFQLGTFRSTDLSELSEHLTIPSIIKLVVQKETIPLVWALRSDGVLLSMAYNRDDLSLKAGWSRHYLGGFSDAAGSPPIVLSIGVIPDPTHTFDQLWMVVQRWINGADVVCIEYMTRVFDDSFLQEDAYQLDCGATFFAGLPIVGINLGSSLQITLSGVSLGFAVGNQVKITGVIGVNTSTTDANGNVIITNMVNEQTFVVKSFTEVGGALTEIILKDFQGVQIVPTGWSPYTSGGYFAKLITTISGLTWLENETVSVLADGGEHPPCVISNSGVLTLNYPAAKVQIGYPYNSDGQLMRLEAGSATGTSIGETRRINRVAAMVHRTGKMSIGMDFLSLVPVEFQTADAQAADNATPLFSGITRDSVASQYDMEGQICFRLQSPLPGTVQAITAFLETNDV